MQCQQGIEYKNERVDARPPHLQRISCFRQLPHSQARRRGQAMDCLVSFVFIGLTTHCIPNHDLFSFCSSVFEPGPKAFDAFPSLSAFLSCLGIPDPMWRLFSCMCTCVTTYLSSANIRLKASTHRIRHNFNSVDHVLICCVQSSHIIKDMSDSLPFRTQRR